MNLVKDKWIPATRANGSKSLIAPWEIGASDNPVVEISAPRPDFRGALYQFLIGLVQTALAPDDIDEWEEGWDKVPSCKELESAFGKFSGAFELTNKNGPAFMQDLNLPEDAGNLAIRALLIDSPGANTIKNNLDHFVKRDSVYGLCDACAATALMTLQTNAPSGGQGHRTSMRGGGPLTTLILPEIHAKGLWGTIWLNIVSRTERFTQEKATLSALLFPWMGATRESLGDKQTFPEQVNEMQLYWGMPRRIRLSMNDSKSGVCDICGIVSNLHTAYRATNYGTSYSGTWLHTLSPYRKQDDGNASVWIATKGKQGGLGYPDWLSLALGSSTGERAAYVINSFNSIKFNRISDAGKIRLWCFGYDMDKMKARCWYDQVMPIVTLSEDKKDRFVESVQMLISAAIEVSRLLRDQVKAAWFERPKDVSGDTFFISTTFIQQTETQFFSVIESLHRAIEKDLDIATILSEWRKIMLDAAERLFDQFAVQETDEIKNIKRISGAAKKLTNILLSPKTKYLQVLKSEGI